MTLTDLKNLVRRYLDEPDSDEFSNAEIVQAINLEFADLCDELRVLGQNYFSKDIVLPVVTTAVEYWLPFDAATIRAVDYFSSADVSGTAPFYVVAADATAEAVDDYELKGNRLVLGTPITDAGYIRVSYWQDAPPLHEGTADGGAASSITMPATPTLGSVLTNDQAYYGLAVYIYSGTGSGQRRWIIKYEGATRTATVDAAWATAPDATSIYSLEAPFGDSMQEMAALGAVLRLKGIAQEDDTSPAARLYMAKMERMITTHGRRLRRTIIKRRG